MTKRIEAPHTAALAAGKVPLRDVAAENVVALTRCSAADIAAWRRMARLDKAPWTDAACAASKGTTVHVACGRPLRIKTTGRGRRLVVPRNASGFARRTKKGAIVETHRERAPHGLRAGDVVRGTPPHADGPIVRGVLATARYDGRCVVETKSAQRNCPRPPGRLRLHATRLRNRRS